MSAAQADDSRVVAEARRLAREAHGGQERKANGQPYFDHVSAVAAMLDAAACDDEVVAAALLHDTVEHTDIEPDQIARGFGERVADLVAAMTDDESIDDWVERKAEHRERVRRCGRDAAAIYAADKVTGVREAIEGYSEVGEDVAARLGNPLDLRLSVWEADLQMLAGFDPPPPGVEELGAELERLRARRVSPAGRS